MARHSCDQHDPTFFWTCDRYCHYVCGQVLKRGIRRYFSETSYPYTQARGASFGAVLRERTRQPRAISPLMAKRPILTRSGEDARFEPRCPERMQVCTNCDPRELTPEPFHRVSCSSMETDAHTAGNSLPFLRLCGLRNTTWRRSGILRGRVPSPRCKMLILRYSGKTLALVGRVGDRGNPRGTLCD